MVPRMPLGVHRWPDTLSEGVRIGSKCGYTGVSSYSRVVFQMSKMAKLADFHDIWDSMDMSKIAIFRCFGGIGDLSGDPPDGMIWCTSYRMYLWICPKGIPGVYGTYMVSHIPIGCPQVARYPLRGCQNRVQMWIYRRE